MIWNLRGLNFRIIRGKEATCSSIKNTIKYLVLYLDGSCCHQIQYHTNWNYFYFARLEKSQRIYGISLQFLCVPKGKFIRWSCYLLTGWVRSVQYQSEYGLESMDQKRNKLCENNWNGENFKPWQPNIRLDDEQSWWNEQKLGEKNIIWIHWNHQEKTWKFSIIWVTEDARLYCKKNNRKVFDLKQFTMVRHYQLWGLNFRRWKNSSYYHQVTYPIVVLTELKQEIWVSDWLYTYIPGNMEF